MTTARLTAEERRAERRAARAAQRAEQEFARSTLRRVIATRKARIYTLQTNGSGETDYVRLFVVKSGEILEITWHVAKAAGRRLTPDGIAYGGGQYSKQLEAADDAWRVRFGEPLKQGQWERLGRAV